MTVSARYVIVKGMPAIQSTPGGRPRAKRPDLGGVGVSKKLENHAAMVALYFMCYNFVIAHINASSGAFNGGWIANHVWAVEGIVVLLR